MSKRDLEDTLDACLDQLDDDESVQACLNRNPEQAADLEPLLRVAAQLRALGRGPVLVAPGLQAGRQKLLGEAARRRSVSADGRRRLRWTDAWGVLRRSGAAVALSALLLLGALGGGTIALAGRSLPGDALYAVKLMTEDVQLVLTLDPESKAQLAARFDERRRSEALAIAGSQRVADISFRGQVESIGVEHWVVGGVAVYISGETEIEQGIGAGCSVRVVARSMSDGKLWAQRISPDAKQPAAPTCTATAPAPTSTPSASPTLKLTATSTAGSWLLPTATRTAATATSTALPTPTRTAVLPPATPTATAMRASPTATREIKVRFKGKIEAMEPGAWTIAGQVVRIDVATRINDAEQPAALGVMASVVATRMADGGLLASEITTERSEQPSGQPFEFRGIIESHAPERWVIGGYSLDIAADTVVEGNPQKGLLAEVKAIRYDDGLLTAKHIVISPPTEEVQFEGTLQAISGSEWTVDGTLVRLDSQSEVLGEPKVGAHVEVQGLLLADGAVLARHVRVQIQASAAPTEQLPLPTQVTPTAVPDTLDVPTATPNAAATSAPQVAASPTAELGMTPGSGATSPTLTVPPKTFSDAPSASGATSVAADSGAAPRDDAGKGRDEGSLIEFRGLIQEVAERYLVASGRIVLITEDTRVVGTPEVGALAEVKGVRMFGNTVLANSVVIAWPDLYSPVQFEGTLESMSQQTWRVGGVTVTISSVTTILGTPALGLVTEVQGVLQADGSVRADRVVIRGSTSAPQIDISGLVEYIEPLQWTVSGTTVLIDERTFIDESHAPAEVGMWAQIRAFRRPHGALLAVRIVLSRPD